MLPILAAICTALGAAPARSPVIGASFEPLDGANRSATELDRIHAVGDVVGFFVD
jgi:hypothetical protein